MCGDLIELVAFAIQDEHLTRLDARRYARAALAVLRPGDLIGPDLVVVTRAAAREAEGRGASTRTVLQLEGGRLGASVAARAEEAAPHVIR